MVWPPRLVQAKKAFGSGFYIPQRGAWGGSLIFWLKKCFYGTPYLTLIHLVEASSNIWFELGGPSSYENLLCSSFSSPALCLLLSKCVRILTHLLHTSKFQDPRSQDCFNIKGLQTCRDSTAWQLSCPLAAHLWKCFHHSLCFSTIVKVSFPPDSPSETVISKYILTLYAFRSVFQQLWNVYFLTWLSISDCHSQMARWSIVSSILDRLVLQILPRW